ncbi:hypothetical protein [Streptomyces sp. NBC_01304]|uniref:hypothetical protein n=1 Tax=Streptomyces sp. NBC_01304 TaxID=2903818 RepID=UPI002E0EB998|nr:hypothetical protein OG430_11750 [Streptomyces sp. NBC_01304]
MISLTKHLGGDTAARACAAACGLGSAEVTLLRRAFGLCLSLRIQLSGDCRSPNFR